MGTQRPGQTPGTAGVLIDLMWFWVPLLLVSAIAFGSASALMYGKKLGVLVAVGWIAVVLAWYARVVFFWG